MKILTVLIVSFIVGCATTTLTEEESALCKGNVTCLTEALDQKIFQAKYDSENKRILQREATVAHIQRCFDSGKVIVEVKRGGTSFTKPLKDRHGVIHLPRHARLGDYICSTSAQMQASFKRAGLF